MTILALALMFSLGCLIGGIGIIVLVAYTSSRYDKEIERRLTVHPSGQKDDLPFNVIDLQK